MEVQKLKAKNRIDSSKRKASGERGGIVVLPKYWEK
jgi:hypothetical protein